MKFLVSLAFVLLSFFVLGQDNSIVIDGREYIVSHVEQSNISCTIRRVEGANSIEVKVKVVALYIPKKAAVLDKQRLTDQWYGDEVYFLGVTDKPYYDAVKDPDSGMLFNMPRNSIFLPVNDKPLDIYTILSWDW